MQLLLLTLEMYPTSEVKAVAERSYRMPEVRGGSRDELPHTQDQGWWWRGATPMSEVRSSSCTLLKQP